MAIALAKFEAGQVLLPERAPWLPDLEAELFVFPGSRYDDQCQKPTHPETLLDVEPPIDFTAAKLSSSSQQERAAGQSARLTGQAPSTNRWSAGGRQAP